MQIEQPLTIEEFFARWTKGTKAKRASEIVLGHIHGTGQTPIETHLIESGEDPAELAAATARQILAHADVVSNGTLPTYALYATQSGGRRLATLLVKLSRDNESAEIVGPYTPSSPTVWDDRNEPVTNKAFKVMAETLGIMMATTMGSVESMVASANATNDRLSKELIEMRARELEDYQLRQRLLSEAAERERADRTAAFRETQIERTADALVELVPVLAGRISGSTEAIKFIQSLPTEQVEAFMSTLGEEQHASFTRLLKSAQREDKAIRKLTGADPIPEKGQTDTPESTT